jgi:DNA repair protein RadA/Sms
VTILIGHVTKRGEIAGPRDLEHNVDCVLYLRNAFRLRLLFVPKNRFGPARLDPLVLMMDARGRLVESPHARASSCAVYGYGGVGDDLAEGQASVTLPRYGSRPAFNAPFLPGKKVKQLLSVLNSLDGVDLSNYSYEINCYVPRRQSYRVELDLPLALALLSSYIQRPVPGGALFVGELDLSRTIRPPESGYLTTIASLMLGPQRGRVGQIYVSNQCATELGRIQIENGGPRVQEVVRVHGVTTLDQLVSQLWPDLGGPN